MALNVTSGVPELLEFDRQAILAGELWRLWTCHLVHYSFQHALVDCATALAAGAVAASVIGWRRVCLVLALSMPFISAVLLLIAPAMLYYRGASGIAVMLVALAACALWPAARWARAALALLMAALFAKIAAEALGLSVTQGWSNLPSGVAVAWQAHLLGAMIGAAYAIVAGPPAERATVG